MSNYLAFLRDNARWLLGGMLMTIFSSFGQSFFIGLYSADLIETFDITQGIFGTIYMVATLASALTLVVIGRIVDLRSVSFVAAMVIIALAAFCVGMAMVPSVWLLPVIIYGLRLFGQGMMTHTAFTAMGRWYASNRGRAVSVATIGHQIGEAAFPPAFVMIALWIGWRESWLVAAAIMIVIALPSIFLLMRKERIPLGQSVGENEVGRQWSRSEVMRDPLFWAMAAGVFAPGYIGTSFFFFQVFLSQMRDWSPTLVPNSFVLVASATLVTALIAGVLIDRFSAARLLPFFLLPLGVANVLLGMVSQTWVVLPYMILLGFSYGLSSSMFGAIWPEIYGTRNLGAVRSMTVALMVLASAVGPGVTGVLIDLGVTIDTQFIGMGLYCLLATGLMILLAPIVHGRRQQELAQSNA